MGAPWAKVPGLNRKFQLLLFPTERRTAFRLKWKNFSIKITREENQVKEFQKMKIKLMQGYSGSYHVNHEK